MKHNILILIIFLFGISAFSQNTTKAPFNGKLLENEKILKYIRIDGSEVTKFNGGKDWVLTQSSNRTNKMVIPFFVKTIVPSKIIYKTLSGNAFSTYDFRNWVKYSDDETYNISSSDKSNTLEVVKMPQQPVNSQLFIEFKLYTDSDVNLIITDLQGQLVYNTTNPLQIGINHFDIDVSSLRMGSYTYKISAGVSVFSGKFIKM
jgi:hypothetical protein